MCHRSTERNEDVNFFIFFMLYSCSRDGGLALRSRLAGADFKPPYAAWFKRPGRERCGKGIGNMSGVDWKGEYK